MGHSWWAKIAAAQANIQISFRLFHNEVWPQVLKLVEWSQQQYEHNQANPPDPQTVVTQLTSINYPYANEIMTALDHNDPKGLSAASSRLIEWTRKMIQGEYDQPVVDVAFQATRTLQDYIEMLDGHGPYTLQQAKLDYGNCVRGTKVNMEKLRQTVYQAISRVEWNNSSIWIYPRPIERAEGVSWSEPGEDALISVVAGGSEGSSILLPAGSGASFTLFVDSDKFHIDDVLEAGDQEFFSDPNVQEDYFNLIKELQSPGSSQKPGKTLRLYTARPVKDRTLYENADKIPPGIFLTTNYGRAEGIAMELSGAETLRDVWEIAIDERFLMQKEHHEDYQAIGTRPIPVKYTRLISPGDM